MMLVIAGGGESWAKSELAQTKPQEKIKRSLFMKCLVVLPIKTPPGILGSAGFIAADLTDFGNLLKPKGEVIPNHAKSEQW